MPAEKVTGDAKGAAAAPSAPATGAAPAVGTVATVRYQRTAPGRELFSGITATRQADAGGNEVWQVAGLPARPAPKAGDTFALMGATDRRVRTVATIVAGSGTFTLTCSVPAGA